MPTIYNVGIGNQGSGSHSLHPFKGQKRDFLVFHIGRLAGGFQNVHPKRGFRVH
jgi:hypothetical protein